jgi:putative hydrolase of the HAD superfamily
LDACSGSSVTADLKVSLPDNFFEGVSHIFWDLDHTIWDFSTNARLTIFELYHKYDLGKKMEHPPETFHSTYIRHNNLAWELYRKGEITKEHLRQRRFRDTFSELGTEPDALCHLFEKEFVELCPTKSVLIPGAFDALTLFSKTYRQHIITNGFKETQAVKMNTSGIHHFFETVTNSEDTGYQKPHPMIFKIAINEAGASVENSIMIGDNYEADILGAHALGMRCVFFDMHEESAEIPKDGIVKINHLNQLLT